MRFRRSTILTALVGVVLLQVAACGGGGEAAPSSTATVVVSSSPEATSQPATPPSPTPTPAPTRAPSPTPEPVGSAFITFTTEDCNFKVPDELGEVTSVTNTDFDNEPQINIERVFQRFHQGSSPSTILRCNMRTAGLFATWWIQSLDSEEAASELYQEFVDTTEIAVRDLNRSLASCAAIRVQEDEAADRYTLDFVDRGLCSGTVFEGMSGLLLHGNNVIGVDSQFYDELFELITTHAVGLLDSRAR